LFRRLGNDLHVRLICETTPDSTLTHKSTEGADSIQH